MALEGLRLKRAQLLHFQGHEIAELLYAGEEYGPVALCIMAEAGGEEADEDENEVENSNGLNFIYWGAGDRRFLLIGAAPPETIKALAGTIASRFGS